MASNATLKQLKARKSKMTSWWKPEGHATKYYIRTTNTEETKISYRYRKRINITQPSVRDGKKWTR